MRALSYALPPIRNPETLQASVGPALRRASDNPHLAVVLSSIAYFSMQVVYSAQDQAIVLNMKYY